MLIISVYISLITGGARFSVEMSATNRYESISTSPDYAVISDEHAFANSGIQFENSIYYSEMPETESSVAPSYNPSPYEILVMLDQVRIG